MNPLKRVSISLILLTACGCPELVMGKDAQALVEKANALYFSGKITKAIALYHEALSADPECLSAALNCAVSYKTIGDPEKAITQFKKVLAARPLDPDIHSELGWIYYHMGRYAEARAAFSAALKIAERHAGALLGLGAADLKNGAPDDAIGALAKLKALRPQFGALNFFLGQAHEMKRADAEAFGYYLETVKKDWAFNEARIHLAKFYGKMGKDQKAWEQIASVKTYDSNNPAVKELEGDLEEFIEPDMPAPQTPAESAEEETAFTPVQPLLSANADIIRAGLWTSATGKPAKIGSFSFRASAPFDVIGLKTGKIFGEGRRGAVWRARFVKNGGYWLIDEYGREIGPFKHAVKIAPRDASATIVFFNIKNSRQETLRPFCRETRGTIELRAKYGRGIYLINELLLEEYLLGVLPSEMPAHWPKEALKAQAVIARNQAVLRKMNYRPHRRDAYDICDSQHCQVYKGVRIESDLSRQALLATAGQTLWHDGRLVPSYYHSSCGGGTRSAKSLKGWGSHPCLISQWDGAKEMGSLPQDPWELNLWIKGNPKASCGLANGAPPSEFRWLRVVPAGVLQRRLNRRFRIGQIKRLIPLRRDISGHAGEFLIEGSKRRKILDSEHLIRYYLGMGSLRSSLIVIEAHKNTKGEIENFWIFGGGWGHGVGLCQTGAAGMAESGGKNYGEILSFYFPGSAVRAPD